jgi:thiosulfate/3-mercaptopyruvate sulfurtransferase
VNRPWRAWASGSSLDPLVSTDWLAARLDDPALRLVDVRWYLDPKRHGRDAYLAGHIHGALFLDVERDLSGPLAKGAVGGRHPWPPPEQVEEVMGHAGIGPETTVIAYDDQAGATAARLWFLLRAHGHEKAAVLDGGIRQWVAEARPIDTIRPEVKPARFQARLQPGLVLGKEEMAALAPGALVLDARAAERYRGDVEPIDPRAGHIPGARSAPFTANLTPGLLPVFLPPAELRRHDAALGAEKSSPIAYCGSGVTACHNLLALHLAGLEGRLYAGSWSEWSNDPGLPVETGESPSSS